MNRQEQDATRIARTLRHLLSAPHPAGDHSLLWDGKDDDGREVAAGVYVARVQGPSGMTTSRVVVAK